MNKCLECPLSTWRNTLLCPPHAHYASFYASYQFPQPFPHTLGFTRERFCCTMPHGAMPIATTWVFRLVLAVVWSLTASPTCRPTPAWSPPVIIQAPIEKNKSRGDCEKGVSLYHFFFVFYRWINIYKFFKWINICTFYFA